MSRVGWHALLWVLLAALFALWQLYAGKLLRGWLGP